MNPLMALDYEPECSEPSGACTRFATVSTIGTSVQYPSASGHGMNSCPCPHQFTHSIGFMGFHPAMIRC